MYETEYYNLICMAYFIYRILEESENKLPVVEKELDLLRKKYADMDKKEETISEEVIIFINKYMYRKFFKNKIELKHINSYCDL